MGAKTKIDTFDSTWNPVSGCRGDCTYCYARDNVRRFGGDCLTASGIKELDEPIYKMTAGKLKAAPYPFGFAPTLFKYRLDIPKHWREPRTIFVVSMGDLFADEIPDEWIKAVFDACRAAPQHRYLFLTKNPSRYCAPFVKEYVETMHDEWLSTVTSDDYVRIPEFWFGTTITGESDAHRVSDLCCATYLVKKFVSVEPLIGKLGRDWCHCIAYNMQWLIVGGMTGREAKKYPPDVSTITSLRYECGMMNKPIFMKSSLATVKDKYFDHCIDLTQQFPWEAEQRERSRLYSKPRWYAP